jgi:uncharacterized membrane protein HdeD (DUF308 family)
MVVSEATGECMMTGTPTYGEAPDTPLWGNAPPSPVVEEEASSSFVLLLVLGVASVVFGIVVLVWPQATARVLAVLVGLWLLVLGATRVIGAFVSRRGLGREILSGIVGVILLIAGVACLRDVAKGVLVLAFLVALAWIFGGLAELVIAVQAGGAVRGWLTVLAVVSIALGLVFIVYPKLSLGFLVLMMGVSALVVGVGEIVFAFKLRRLASIVDTGGAAS